MWPARGRETRRREAIGWVAEGLRRQGACLTLEQPDGPPIRIGARPETARVILRSGSALDALARRDELRLAEAYLDGDVELEGDLFEVMRITELIPPRTPLRERAAFAWRMLLRDRRRLQRDSVAFHYDRPAAFFLPWLERWRSYSHGVYTSPDDPPDEAQARKLQFAIDALGLKPGDRVLDMGCGWGSFVEYAGLQGIRVHGITISEAQRRFVDRLIREERLPCRVELVDLLDLRPSTPYSGAVFMGTFEHFPDYAFAARFLARHLAPGARVYADFCSRPGSQRVGAFLARHIWPGTALYVSVPKLVTALEREGLSVETLLDDTASYALTVRDWARAFEDARGELAVRFGEHAVRAFRLYLAASHYYLCQRKTLAYRLVARTRRSP